MKMHKMFKKLFGAALAAALLVSGMAMPAFAAEIEWIDFEDVEETTDMTGNAWEMPLGFYRPRASAGGLSWTVEDGVMKYGNMGWNESANGEGSGEWERYDQKFNYVFESRFKPGPETTASWETLRWRVRCSTDVWQQHYSFEYNYEGNYQLRKSSQDPGNQYNQVLVALKQPGTDLDAKVNKSEVGDLLSANQWHTVQVAIAGDATTGIYVTAYIDGKLVLQGVDNDTPYTHNGYYGFANAGFDAEMDDIYLAEFDQINFKDATFTQVRDASQLNAGETITANAFVFNDTDASMTRNLVVAWYDADGNLERVGVEPITLEGKGLQQVTAELTLPENIDGGMLKAFMWDDIAGMKPAEEITVKTLVNVAE